MNTIDVEVTIEEHPTDIVVEVNYNSASGSGVSSPESVISSIAGEALSGGRVVSVIAGKAYYFDPNSEAMYGRAIGLTKTSAVLNSPVTIQLDGSFYESGLGVEADKMYYAGLNGTLTTNTAGLKIIQTIGVSLNSNTIAININSQPIQILQ